MARAKNTLGLDIGSSSIKVVQLKETKKGKHLVKLVEVQLPADTIVDGALMNSSTIVDAIVEVVRTNKIKNKDVAISISGHSVIIKKLNLPAQSEQELDESIMWEAEDVIPFDIKDVQISAQILSPTSSTRGRMDVLLVAAKKELVNDYTALVNEAGLNPVIVDVATFALSNAFEANYDLPLDSTIGLINIGASIINLSIISNGSPSFTRDISFGGKNITQEIQRQMNVSYDEAEKLKLGGYKEHLKEKIESIIKSVSENLAGEIQRSLDFYTHSASEGSSISKIYLSGGTAKIPYLPEIMQNRLGYQVNVLDPFLKIHFNEKDFSPEYIKANAPVFAVAIGLGLRNTKEE